MQKKTIQSLDTLNMQILNWESKLGIRNLISYYLYVLCQFRSYQLNQKDNLFTMKINYIQEFLKYHQLKKYRQNVILSIFFHLFRF